MWNTLCVPCGQYVAGATPHCRPIACDIAYPGPIRRYFGAVSCHSRDTSAPSYTPCKGCRQRVPRVNSTGGDGLQIAVTPAYASASQGWRAFDLFDGGHHAHCDCAHLGSTTACGTPLRAQARRLRTPRTPSTPDRQRSSATTLSHGHASDRVRTTWTTAYCS